MGDTNSTKPQQEQPGDPLITCEICIELMLSNKKKFRNNNLCVHPFCNECITKYVQSKNEEERVAGIECPGSNCDKLLDPLTCPALVPPEVSDRCYCPNQVCSAVVVKECGAIVKKSMCPNCKHCVEHVHGCPIIKCRDFCRCGRSFSYECGRKVHQHQCYCKDKANKEDTTKKEKHTDINKEQVVPHQCSCKDKANEEDTIKKENTTPCAFISICIVSVTLYLLLVVLYAASITLTDDRAYCRT